MLRSVLLGAAALSAAIATSCGDSPLSVSAQRGHKVFMELADPACATCHTFKHAGTVGSIGTNLDQMRYSRDAIVRAVTQGVDQMPSQKDKLTPTQIGDVAQYLMEAFGRDKGE